MTEDTNPPTTASEEKTEETEEKPTEKLAETVEKLKEENDRKEKLLAREEELAAQKLLGGSSDTGQAPEPPKEETPQEYAQRVIRGEVGAGEDKQK
jgi:hypothetical protein